MREDESEKMNFRVTTLTDNKAETNGCFYELERIKLNVSVAPNNLTEMYYYSVLRQKALYALKITSAPFSYCNESHTVCD